MLFEFQKSLMLITFFKKTNLIKNISLSRELKSWGNNFTSKTIVIASGTNQQIKFPSKLAS